MINEPEDDFEDEFERRKETRPPQYTHHPEFVIIDDGNHRQQTSSRASSGSQKVPPFTSIEQLSEAHYPLSIRLLCTLLSLLMVFSSIAAAILTGIFALGVVFTLGKHEYTRNLFDYFWGWWRKTLVLALGFFVAFFSPPFGFSIIIIYFVLMGEKLNQELLRRVMQTKDDL